MRNRISRIFYDIFNGVGWNQRGAARDMAAHPSLHKIQERKLNHRPGNIMKFCLNLDICIAILSVSVLVEGREFVKCVFFSFKV